MKNSALVCIARRRSSAFTLIELLVVIAITAILAVIAGEPYRISASTNLQNWKEVTSFVAASTNRLFIDPAALNQPRRFYRAGSPWAESL